MLVRPRGRRVPAFLLALALASSAFAPSSQAAEPPVAIGEVSGKIESGEFTPTLRRALEQELSAAELGRRDSRERFVLSATLVRLTAEHKDGNARATAVVSMALRRVRENTLYAILSGRATAEEAAPGVDSARDSALRAAVRSALRRLPDAVSSK